MQPGEGERRSGATKTYHTDALGSVRGITSAAQSATDAALYDAFGLVVSRTGSTPTPFGYAGDWQYQGDADSGLMLLGHRYYDPSTGRFLSQDPIGDGDNWYAYCENEPLGWVDPEGLDFSVGGRRFRGYPRNDHWPPHVHEDGKPSERFDRDGNPIDSKGKPDKSRAKDRIPRKWREKFRREFDKEINPYVGPPTPVLPAPHPSPGPQVDWPKVGIGVGIGVIVVIGIIVAPEVAIPTVAGTAIKALAH